MIGTEPLDSRTDRSDAVVLGAGISGLVAASILQGAGCGRVVVLDEYDRVGGNHLDHHSGDCTFDVGSLVFQDDSPLLAHFPGLLPRYVEIDPSWGKLTPQGAVARYPFSVREDVLAAGVPEMLRIGLSAARARLRRRPLRTAGDFARYWIGPRLLHRSGLESYMERFCGLPADRIDLGFAQKRMLWISEYARVGSVARLLRVAREENTEGIRTNAQLARPREGFAHLYAPAVDQLERGGAEFRLGARPERIRRDGDGFVVEHDGRELRTDRVVSTIPVDTARELCGIPGDPLPTVTLVSLYYSFAGDRGFADPILYNFSHGGAWKRLTVYSDFYGRAAGDREYFGVEVVTGPAVRTVEAAAADFRRHTTENGLFTGDLRLEGGNVLRHAYPIYTDGASERAAGSVAALREFGVESFGRQGGFEYQPTARVSTVHAEQELGGGPPVPSGTTGTDQAAAR